MSKNTPGLREVPRERGKVGDPRVGDDQLRVVVPLDERRELVCDRGQSAPSVDEDGYPALGGECEDRVEPLVVQKESLCPRVELDPARAEVEAAPRLLFGSLGEVEADEGDQSPVRPLGVCERPVVGGAEAGMTIGLVEAEHEGALHPEAVHDRVELFLDADRAVDVGPEMNVCVEHGAVRRDEVGELVGRSLEELLGALERVHEPESMQGLGRAAGGPAGHGADRMRQVPDVLIIGDTMRVPELRHEVPLGIGDPFLYAEKDGNRYVFASSLEMPRLRELRASRRFRTEEVGQDELLHQGIPREQIMLELAVRSCRRIELADALVPRFFPLASADRLRSEGIELTPDREFFNARRRVKSPAELEGIRRAQKAAEAGMAAAGELLGRASANGGGYRRRAAHVGVDQGRDRLRLRRLRLRVGRVHRLARGAVGDRARGRLRADPAERADRDRPLAAGHGVRLLRRHDPYVRGGRALGRASGVAAALQAGPGRGDHEDPARRKGVDIFRGTCELFEEHGYPTQLTKEPGTVLDEGFFHGLGHGVGLDVHEDPNLGIAGDYELVAGDVITVEPGLYRPGFGGCRLEDLVLVTEDGAENLTVFPYDLAP